MYSYHKYQKTMALPPVQHSPRHALLPLDEGEAIAHDRRYGEDDREDTGNNYPLANQHHVIGDSDDEGDGINDADISRHNQRSSREEQQELLVGGNR
jgi:hypothetical protein